jgi:hypothetical protein
MRLLIRYFATTDDSPTGKVSLEYLKSLLRIAPVRVGSMTGMLSGAWEPYAQLLATPLHARYVNIVCCASSRWSWVQNVPMTNSKGQRDGVASGRQELYTAGVHNVLLTPSFPVDPYAIATAARYEAVVTPTDRYMPMWHKHAIDTTVIPIPISNDIDHARLRSAVTPA